MVTVQLVENSVKRMVGILMVAIRITQYSTVEMRLSMIRISRPKAPSHPECSWATTASVALLTAEAIELV